MLLSLDGRSVYFDLVGPADAPTVYFNHSLSSDSGMWAEQIPPLLEAGYRVLRVDLQGHGGSAPGLDDCTMDALADDVRATLDVLQIERVHYVGLSIGGMIGQGFALAHQQRLASLTLCATQSSTPADWQPLWEERKATVRRAGTLEPLADDIAARWFTDEFSRVNPDRFRQLRDTIVGTTPTGFLCGASAIQTFDYEDRLGDITVPTLVISGDEDIGTPPHRLQLIADKVADGRHACLAGAGHLPNVERPDEFNRAMLEFLEANR